MKRILALSLLSLSIYGQVETQTYTMRTEAQDDGCKAFEEFLRASNETSVDALIVFLVEMIDTIQTMNAFHLYAIDSTLQKLWLANLNHIEQIQQELKQLLESFPRFNTSQIDALTQDIRSCLAVSGLKRNLATRVIDSTYAQRIYRNLYGSLYTYLIHVKTNIPAQECLIQKLREFNDAYDVSAIQYDRFTDHDNMLHRKRLAMNDDSLTE